MWGPPGLVPGDAAPPPTGDARPRGAAAPRDAKVKRGLPKKVPGDRWGHCCRCPLPVRSGGRGTSVAAVVVGLGVSTGEGLWRLPASPPPPFLPVPTSHISCPHIPLCPTSHVPAFPFPPSPRPRCPCPTSSCPPVPKSRPPHILNLMSPYPISQVPMSPSPRSFVLSPYVASLSPCPPTPIS